MMGPPAGNRWHADKSGEVPLPATRLPTACPLRRADELLANLANRNTIVAKARWRLWAKVHRESLGSRVGGPYPAMRRKGMGKTLHVVRTHSALQDPVKGHHGQFRGATGRRTSRPVLRCSSLAGPWPWRALPRGPCSPLFGHGRTAAAVAPTCSIT